MQPAALEGIACQQQVLLAVCVSWVVQSMCDLYVRGVVFVCLAICGSGMWSWHVPSVQTLNRIKERRNSYGRHNEKME